MRNGRYGVVQDPADRKKWRSRRQGTMDEMFVMEEYMRLQIILNKGRDGGSRVREDTTHWPNGLRQ